MANFNIDKIRVRPILAVKSIGKCVYETEEAETTMSHSDDLPALLIKKLQIITENVGRKCTSLVYTVEPVTSSHTSVIQNESALRPEAIEALKSTAGERSLRSSANLQLYFCLLGQVM